VRGFKLLEFRSVLPAFPVMHALSSTRAGRRAGDGKHRGGRQMSNKIVNNQILILITEFEAKQQGEFVVQQNLKGDIR
jgi:hypothetical protein